LGNLALVFVLLFGAAFSCGQNGSSGRGQSSQSTATDDDEESSSGRLTEEVVKRFVTRKAQALVTGTEVSPKSVDITFESIQFGTPRTANLNDEFEGVPKDATVYPVKVRYTKTNHYNAAGAYEPGKDIEEKYYYAYDFYERDGEWDALSKGPVH
jgi:hypothetical protein